MQNWIIPANSNKYNHAASFEKNKFIDWRQVKNGKYAVGDIVYLYCTAPIKKVVFKTQVIRTNMKYSDCIDDVEFWTDMKLYELSKSEDHARLLLLAQADRDELSLRRLESVENGLKGTVQHPTKISNALAEYIDKYLHDDYAAGIFPDSFSDSELPDRYYEGAIQLAYVNRYERSSVARSKCIEHYGCACQICGFDFEQVYGEVGKGFIHVHHVIPLNQINEEYTVDYIRDLIPVWPNCHAMLHRTLNDASLTINQLKAIIRANSQ